MKIGIVGGGVAGLSAAYHALKEGYEVELFERGKNLGGQLQTMKINGHDIEILYHHAFATDYALWKICKELGIYHRVRWLESKMGYYSDNKLYDFGTPASLLKFKPLNFIAKIRFVLSILAVRFYKLKETKNITAKKWFLKIGGKKVWEKIWFPLFHLKFDDLADKISFTWIWDKLMIRSTSRGKGSERLAYMDGSFGMLTKRMEEEILRMGGKIHRGTTIDKVNRKRGKFSIVVGRKKHDCDKVIVAAPQGVLTHLFKFKGNFKEWVGSYEYVSATVALFEMKKPFTDRYWTNIGDTSLPFGGLIEQSNFWDVYGKSILYISRYHKKDHPFVAMPEKEILELYYKGMKKIKPSFQKSDIEKAHLFKVRDAQPVIPVGYRRPPIRTEIDGVYWISTHHAYPHDRGINYAVAMGKRAVQLLQTKP